MWLFVNDFRHKGIHTPNDSHYSIYSFNHGCHELRMDNLVHTCTNADNIIITTGLIIACDYLFAILFLIFDVEVAFLVPWAVVFQDLGAVAFIEILVFLIILGLGLLYAWKKGALKWE